MSIKPIYKKDFTFCPPLPGKPNPKKSYMDTAPLAERVVQSGQKNNTCLYYALNYIRERIGKNPTESQQEARAVEKMISERRKNQTKMQKEWLWYRSLASEATSQSPSQIIGKKEAAYLLKDGFYGIKETYKKPLKTLMTLFCKQSVYSDLLTFTKETYAEKMFQIDQLFLEKVRYSYGPSFSCVELSKAITWSPDQTKCSTAGEKSRFLQKVAHEAIFRLYNLQKSSWHPQLPIESLILTLRVHGPLAVGGFIGQVYYKDDPMVVGKVGKKNIYGWKAGAEKIELNISHFAVVVGAKKVVTGNKKDLVYFVDPVDVSDPKDKDAPKVYVMSYNRFLEKVATLDGQVFVGTDGATYVPMKKGENNYALYGPAKTSPSSSSSSMSSSSSSSGSSSSSSFSSLSCPTIENKTGM